MAVIRTFKALRAKKELANLVASVPYDVVNTEEAAKLAEGNQFTLLRVTRSEIELDSAVDHYSPEVYAKAKVNLEKLISDKVLSEDDNASFYFYRQIMGNHSQIGIAATFAVSDYDANVVMKHEKTRKDKEDDRTNHISTTNAQTGPVFLTYISPKAVDEIVEKVVTTQQPEYDFTASDGIRHTVWVCPAEYNQTIVEEVAKVKNLYIADGHHRAASASRTQKVKKEANLAHNGTEEYNFFLAVLFPENQLSIMPYNRVVFELNGNTEEQYFEKIKEYFDIEKTDSKEPSAKKSFCMYYNKQWYSLKANSNVKSASNVGDNLDVSILQNYLLQPILGIDDPRTSKKIDFIGGIRGTKELEHLVDSGKAIVAFSVYPVTVKELMAISDAGEIMPPKSTWFEPKLRDGLLVHLI